MPNELSRRKSQNSFRTIKSASSNQLATVMKMRARSRTAPPLARQLGALLVLLALGPALGLLFSNAQYSSPSSGLSSSVNLNLNSAASALLLQQPSGYCDSARLVRCQQEAVRELQLAGLQSASAQLPLQSLGPPYSPAAKLREQQALRGGDASPAASQASCRLVRASLDCLLATSGACHEAGLQAALDSGALALRSKRFLELSACNEPDSSWQSAGLCFRAPEVRNCEQRLGFSPFAAGALTINSTSCLAYRALKLCVESHARLNCKVHELDMTNEYLIDRAGELAWRCPQANSSAPLLGATNGLQYGHYGLSNGPTGSLLSPVASYGGGGGGGGGSSGSVYAQRDHFEQRPSYVGSSGNINLFAGPQSVRDQAWERFRLPVDDNTRFGISRFPSANGEVFDRLVATNAGFDADSSDCPVKAAPYARECEDTLIEQQRMARDSRDGSELQRRVCCSLFQYRDCISRVVLDRCADSSPAAVDVLMGLRRREMVLTCRGFNRDLCSGAAALASSPLLLGLVSLAATLLLSLKGRQTWLV